MDLNQLNKIYHTNYFSIWEMIQTISIAEEHLLMLTKEFPIYWENVIVFQKVSIDFIKEYIIACEKTQTNVNWDVISKVSNLPVDFIEKYKEQLKWALISEFHELSLDFVNRYESDIYWGFLAVNLTITDEIIFKYLHRINFGTLSANSNVSENIIETFWNRFNREKLLQTKELSQEFIRKNILKIGIDNILIRYQYIPEDVIIEHIDKFKDWLSLICKHQQMSEDFLMRYAHKINKQILCEHQSLSEKFMHQYRYYLDWHLVSRLQKLSVDFIKQHEQFIDFVWLSTNTKITPDVLDVYESELNWRYVILYNPYITLNQICKHGRQISILNNIIKTMNSSRLNKNLLITIIDKERRLMASHYYK